VNLGSKKSPAQCARELFQEGYNCSQSVLLAMFEYWSARKNELIPKIATGFGGGIGRCGSVCGALTGSIMAMGVKYGTNEPSAKKRSKAYEIAKRLYREFEVQNGSVYCRELTGCDLTSPEGIEKARKTRVFEEKCLGIVENSVKNLLKLSEESR
jgi:C_GCAxxG_C_C family probable redox protein